MTQRRLSTQEIARVYDVPPWLVDPGTTCPPLARLRWRLRRIVPRLVWRKDTA